MAMSKLITPDIFFPIAGSCTISTGRITSVPPNSADKITTESPYILNLVLHKLPES